MTNIRDAGAIRPEEVNLLDTDPLDPNDPAGTFTRSALFTPRTALFTPQQPQPAGTKTP